MVRREELRSVGDRARPCVAAGEPASTRWPPQNGSAAVRDRANEIPLDPAKVSRLPLKQDPLINPAALNVERTFGVPKMRRNRRCGGHFASIRVRPLNHAINNAA